MSKDPFGVCQEPECHDVPEPPKEMPSTYNQLKGFILSAKDVVGGAMAGDGVLVSESVRELRLSICHGCEFFEKQSQRCTQCGCFMNTKSMFKQTYCPVSKWDKEV